MNLPKWTNGKVIRWLAIAVITATILGLIGRNADVLFWTISHSDEVRASMRVYQDIHREADEDFYSRLSVKVVSPMPEEVK